MQLGLSIRRYWLAAMIGGAAALFPSSVHADYAACAQVCRYDSPCDEVCYPDPYEPWLSDCGSQGVCEAYCQPNWVRVSGSERRIGRRFDEGGWNHFRNCHDIVAFDVIDTNGCAWTGEKCETQGYHVSSDSECPEYGVQECACEQCWP